MLENYLFPELSRVLDGIAYKSLCELRLRAGSPVMANISGENHYISSSGITENIDEAFVVSRGFLQSVIQKLSNNSLYTINDQLIDGYVTISGGIRVGVCGEVVQTDGKIKTVKNISSLNFRFPHNVKNCSLPVYNYIVSNGRCRNTLIVSPPGAGKTTLLRDLIYQLTQREKYLNILVVDERQELAEIFNGKDIFRLTNIDVISNSTKKYAFNNGIRSMKPSLIVTDEIDIDRDIFDIKNAITSGVSVIASIHAKSVFDLREKSPLFNSFTYPLFDRYIVLSSENGVGTIEGVYDEKMCLIGY